MKPDHVKWIKRLDPADRPEPKYTLAELQEAMKIAENEAVKGYEVQSYWFAFTSSCFGIYVMPTMFSLIGEPILAMIACSGCAVAGCFWALKLGRFLKKEVESNDDNNSSDRSQAD